ALRCRALRLRAARVAPTIRRNDRRRYTDQQDGAGLAQGLRPDAGAALRDLYGIVCEWGRLLSLFVFRRARLRSHCAGRHLCAGLSADRGSAALRRDASAEENPPYRHNRALDGVAEWTTRSKGLGRRSGMRSALRSSAIRWQMAS